MQQRTELELRINALNMQRGELQSQLGQLDGRRNQLLVQTAQSEPGPARSELRARMSELDARSKQLDAQIQGLNDQIAATMGELASVPAVPATPRASGISVPPIESPSSRPIIRQVGGMMMAEAVVLVMVFSAFWRFGMRRMREQFARAFGDQAAQLGQLQQAVDVIGVEVERISEGQRYVAKMLTEGSPAGVGGQAKAPVGVRRDA
jgi:cell division protein FtsB